LFTITITLHLKTIFRNIYYFLPVVDSPGVAFLVPGVEEGASAMAIFDSVLTGKPILILTVIMALLAGIVMWMLVRYNVVERCHFLRTQFLIPKFSTFTASLDLCGHC